MDLSGIIFVVLAIAWAVYLIPKTLKQHDEVARSRSLDRFSGTLRVLARREPVNRRDSRLVVGPSVPATRSVTTVAPTGMPVATTVTTVVPASSDAAARGTLGGSSGPAARSQARRTSSRAAARRRRRVLLALLVGVAAIAVAAYLTYLPGWAVAVPAALTVAWLVLCRSAARRESARRPAPRRGERTEAAGVAVEAPVGSEDAGPAVEAPVGAPVAPVAVPSRSGATAVQLHAPDDLAARIDQEDTVGIPVAQLEAVLRGPLPAQSPAQPYSDSHPEPGLEQEPPSGTLWDPLPVTLPTYVTKPKARRTVRTIDLGEPGAWTSGRTPQDAEIAARATDSPDAAPADEGSGEGGRRAVGS